LNEIIEEEDEDKNNPNKEFFRKNNKNKENINNIVLISEKNKKKEDTNKNKQNIIWGNSNYDKKNTYDNLFYKKKYEKKFSTKDNVFPEYLNTNSGIILPDLKKTTTSNNEMKKSLNSQNPRAISSDKSKPIQNMNLNSVTSDTSAFTHSSKKYLSPTGQYTKNYTEDLSKFRMGLLSAGTSSNNNVIIPMIPIRRPVSNFNFGVGQLWNNLENNNLSTNNKNLNNSNNMNKNEIIIFDSNKSKNKNINKILESDISQIKKDNNNNINNKMSYNFNSYKKGNNEIKTKPIKSQDMKKNLDIFHVKNDISNFYIGMTKLHKIKIEKGMMNSGLINSLNKKFTNDLQNQIQQFKKNNLPMMFSNIQNKNNNLSTDKNRTRSHSLNNRNNY